MSFYFEKTATPAKMKELLDKDQSIPQPVRDFIVQGMDGALANPSAPINAFYVKTNGHLCTGPGSHNITTILLEVKPLVIES